LPCSVWLCPPELRPIIALSCQLLFGCLFHLPGKGVISSWVSSALLDSRSFAFWKEKDHHCAGVPLILPRRATCGLWSALAGNWTPKFHQRHLVLAGAVFNWAIFLINVRKTPSKSPFALLAT
jgi:hypothetical protein